jgi:hypothetical protein
MKQNEAYRLEALLRLRQREEDEAKASLAQAEADLRGAEASANTARIARDARADALRESREQAAALVSKKAARLRTEQALVERCRAELEAAEAVLSRARRVIDEVTAVRDAARERLATRARARETIDKHRARWLETKQKAAARREEVRLDEIAASQEHRKGPK